MYNKLNFKNVCICVFMSVYSVNVGSYAFIQMPCTHKNAEVRSGCWECSPHWHLETSLLTALWNKQVFFYPGLVASKLQWFSYLQIHKVGVTSIHDHTQVLLTLGTQYSVLTHVHQALLPTEQRSPDYVQTKCLVIFFHCILLHSYLTVSSRTFKN